MKEELVRLIQENPDLDVVTMVSTDTLTDEYGYLLQFIRKVEVTDIYRSPDEETLYFDKSDLIEELQGIHDADEEYLDLEDYEYVKQMEKLADNYFEKKAIVIWTRDKFL